MPPPVVRSTAPHDILAPMVHVCFVCLGNICRSPMAEGVMRHLVAAAGLGDTIAVESAGTSAYHEGEPPDARSRAAARARGIDVGGRSRRFVRQDFSRFDYVIAMDTENLDDLIGLAPDPAAERKVSLLLAFDPASPPHASVPDPYYGGADGFGRVLDLCTAGCRGLIEHIRREQGIR
ncbi:MAG: low molecular weight phosphotyrosine protein phosphatase [Polyangiaceae bacterium]|nr:low molecular weight phosphotyrosine protein phosphatase [Polyangiaceae bacterium]